MKFSLMNGITIDQIIKILPSFDGLSIRALDYISEYKKDLSEYSSELFNSFLFTNQIVNNSMTNHMKNLKIKNNENWIYFDYEFNDNRFKALVIGYDDKVCIECFYTDEDRRRFYENI